MLLNNRILLVSDRRARDKVEMYEHLAQSYENIVVNYCDIRIFSSKLQKFSSLSLESEFHTVYHTLVYSY